MQHSEIVKITEGSCSTENVSCQADIDKGMLDIASFSQVSAAYQIRESTLHDDHLSVSADESNAVNTRNI